MKLNWDKWYALSIVTGLSLILMGIHVNHKTCVDGLEIKPQKTEEVIVETHAPVAGATAVVLEEVILAQKSNNSKQDVHLQFFREFSAEEKPIGSQPQPLDFVSSGPQVLDSDKLSEILQSTLKETSESSEEAIDDKQPEEIIEQSTDEELIDTQEEPEEQLLIEEDEQQVYTEAAGAISENGLPTEATMDQYNVPLSDEQKAILYKFKELFNVDCDVTYIYGLMCLESKFTNSAESNAGAKGLCQMMPTTFSTEYEAFIQEYPEYKGYVVNDIWDAQTNMIIALFYMKDIKEQANLKSLQDETYINRMLVCYNCGVGGAGDQWVSGYSSEVMKRAHYLQKNLNLDTYL
jgi:hypothetical protein